MIVQEELKIELIKELYHLGFGRAYIYIAWDHDFTTLDQFYDHFLPYEINTNTNDE